MKKIFGADDSSPFLTYSCSTSYCMVHGHELKRYKRYGNPYKKEKDLFYTFFFFFFFSDTAATAAAGAFGGPRVVAACNLDFYFLNTSHYFFLKFLIFLINILLLLLFRFEHRNHRLETN